MNLRISAALNAAVNGAAPVRPEAYEKWRKA